MATQIEGLDVRLEGLAASLDDNKAALLANADSLSAIGVQLGSVADDLRTGIVQDSLSDVQVVLTARPTSSTRSLKPKRAARSTISPAPTRPSTSRSSSTRA
jgi:hypothetical protein